MRLILILLFAATALWVAVGDWQATIGEGNAYRLRSLGTGLAEVFPGNALLDGIAGNTFGAMVLQLPLALALGGIAGLLWITRSRRR